MYVVGEMGVAFSHVILPACLTPKPAAEVATVTVKLQQ